MRRARLAAHARPGSGKLRGKSLRLLSIDALAFTETSPKNTIVEAHEEESFMGKPAIRALVVDDYEPWSQFVCSTLEALSELRVVGKASDGLEAVHKAQELQPDLILLDISLPTINGIEAARRIREVSPFSKILFVSADHYWDVAIEILRTGAGGYIVKSEAAGKLLPAVEAVLQGRPFLSIGLTDLSSFHLDDERSTYSARHERVAVTWKARREVRLYPDDTAFVGGFASSIAAALKGGREVVVAGTESDHAGILQKLSSDGMDVAVAIERNLLVLLDIADAHSTFIGDNSTRRNRSPNIVPHEIGNALLTAKEEHLCAAVA